jgi:hypothetical protein
MNEIHNFLPAIYIFENPIAKRIKVGTTTDRLENRLNDLNDIWSGRKVICQICGGRLVNENGMVPLHVVSGIKCQGSNSLPIERDVALAKLYLNELKNQIVNLNGSEKASVTRRIKNLIKRISLFENISKPTGTWKLSVVYYTNNADKIESKAHTLLSNYKDIFAPIGEIFVCTVIEASNAVETALGMFNLEKTTIKKFGYEISLSY